MTKIERRHLENFRRECAACNLPHPTVSALCECALIKPRVSVLGNIVGENALEAAAIYSTLADCRLIKPSRVGGGFWAMEPLENGDTGESYMAIWYISFMIGDGTSMSAAVFALDCDSDELDDGFKGGWTYAR